MIIRFAVGLVQVLAVAAALALGALWILSYNVPTVYALYFGTCQTAISSSRGIVAFTFRTGLSYVPPFTWETYDCGTAGWSMAWADPAADWDAAAPAYFTNGDTVRVVRTDVCFLGLGMQTAAWQHVLTQHTDVPDCLILVAPNGAIICTLMLFVAWIAWRIVPRLRPGRGFRPTLASVGKPAEHMPDSTENGTRAPMKTGGVRRHADDVQ
jgi:hypothetical protein